MYINESRVPSAIACAPPACSEESSVIAKSSSRDNAVDEKLVASANIVESVGRWETNVPAKGDTVTVEVGQKVVNARHSSCTIVSTTELSSSISWCDCNK